MVRRPNLPQFGYLLRLDVPHEEVVELPETPRAPLVFIDHLQAKLLADTLDSLVVGAVVEIAHDDDW